jgi:hypothetical protein
MFSRSLLVNCAAAFLLAGAGWAQMQPPGSQPQPVTGPPMGPPQGTMPSANGTIPQAQQADPSLQTKTL